MNSIQTPQNRGQHNILWETQWNWNAACFSSALLLRKDRREMNGEKGSGESRRSLCMQLPSSDDIPCLRHRLRLNWKTREHVPISDSCLTCLARPCQGETQQPTIGPPDFTGRRGPGCLGKGYQPAWLGPTGNSPKPFGVDAALMLINPKLESQILYKWHNGTDFALSDQRKNPPLVWG